MTIAVRPCTLLPKNIFCQNRTVFTDDVAAYHGLNKHYDHHRINHSEKLYVMGDVHTQTIKRFQSEWPWRGVANHHKYYEGWQLQRR